MARDNISKVQGLVRQLQRAYTGSSQALHDRYRFSEQYDANNKTLVHTLVCESYPTVSDYAKFFTEFQSVCLLNPTWHSITHDVQEEETNIDDDVRCTISGYAYIDNIVDSPVWKDLVQHESNSRQCIAQFSNEIVDLVRNIQANNTKD